VKTLYTPKLDPHPHDSSAFGLKNLNLQCIANEAKQQGEEHYY
jgi:hypothetical protein